MVLVLGVVSVPVCRVVFMLGNFKVADAKIAVRHNLMLRNFKVRRRRSAFRARTVRGKMPLLYPRRLPRSRVVAA